MNRLAFVDDQAVLAKDIELARTQINSPKKTIEKTWFRYNFRKLSTPETLRMHNKDWRRMIIANTQDQVIEVPGRSNPTY